MNHELAHENPATKIETVHVASRTRAAGMLVGATFGNGVSITPAVHSVFGTFLIPITKEFHWGREQVSLVLTIVAVTASIGYPLVGSLSDKWGTRRFLLVGYALFALSLVLLAFLNGSLSNLYIVFALVGLSGSIPSTALLSKYIAQRFARNRGIALGLTAGFGNAAGCIVMPIVAAILLQAYGWRTAYAGVSVIVLVVGVLATFFLLPEGPAPKREKKQVREPRSGGVLVALSDKTFLMLIMAIGLGGGSGVVVFSHIVPVLAEHNIDLNIATTVLSFTALSSILTQLFVGRLLDWVPSPYVVVPFYLAAIPGLLLLEFTTGLPTVILGGLLFGVSSGAQFAALPYYIARYFDIARFGLLIGLMYSAVVIAQGSLPVALDSSFDVFGTYKWAIIVGTIAYLIGAATLLFLPKYPDAKRDETEISAIPVNYISEI